MSETEHFIKTLHDGWVNLRHVYKLDSTKTVFPGEGIPRMAPVVIMATEDEWRVILADLGKNATAEECDAYLAALMARWDEWDFVETQTPEDYRPAPKAEVPF